VKRFGFFRKTAAFLTSLCFMAELFIVPAWAANLNLIVDHTYDLSIDQPYGSDLGKFGDQPVLVLMDPSFDLQLTPEESALRLYYLGLMSGNVSDDMLTLDFALEDTLTRLEAVVMAIRLMGQDSAVHDMDLTNDYSDVPTWGSPYVAYAENCGITEYLFPVKTGARRKICA